MNNYNDVINFLSSSNVNLIVSEKNFYTNILIISYCLNEYINRGKNIYMYCLEESRNFYMSNLISLITGIDKHTIYNYNDSCNVFNIGSKETLKLDQYDNYFNGMKKIIESNLLVEEYADSVREHIINEDLVDRILLENENMQVMDIIIIDSLSLLVKNSKYSGDEIIERINDYSLRYKTKFLIFDSFNNYISKEDIFNIINVYETKENIILKNNNNQIIFR